MSAPQILKKSRFSSSSVRDEMAGRVPERDFMDFSDRNFQNARSYHTLSSTGNVKSVPRSSPLRHSGHPSKTRPPHSTESALLAADGFDLGRAVRDPVVEPGVSLVLNPAAPSRTSVQAWKGTDMLLQQARCYLSETLTSLRHETEIIGAFDTNQQKSSALKAFVPLEEYSDARHRERAKLSFEKSRDRYFDKMDPLPPEDASAPFLERPEAYAVFRDLENRCKTRWLNKDETCFDEALNTEQPVVEVVTPEYCERFRFPKPHSPLLRASERRLCRNGTKCVCKTMNPACGYIAVEFLTPRENRYFEETGTYAREVPHLCLDCELAWYTEHVYLACRTNDPGVSSAINRFRVTCEEGGYSKRTMLTTMLGTNTLTGIVGMVPTFDEDYRAYVPVDNAPGVYRVTEVHPGLDDFITLPVHSRELLRTRCTCNHVEQWVRDFYVRSPPYPVYSDRALQLHAFQTRGDTTPVCCVLAAACPPRTNTATLATNCRVPAVVLRRLFSGVHAGDILDSHATNHHPTLRHFLGYPKNRIEFAGRLNAIVDLAFSPFEDTLTAFSNVRFMDSVWPWILFGFKEAVLVSRTRWMYWRGFLIPDSGLESCIDGDFVPSSIHRRSYVLFFVLLWRIHVAEVIRSLLLDAGNDVGKKTSFIHELVLRREADPHYVNPNVIKQSRNIDYAARQLHSRWLRALSEFQDSHVPLLTKMVESGNYHDNPALLALHYPSISDSLCSDELPDMTPLLPFSGVWFEYGSKSNARSSAYAIAHFFLGKTNMQSCQTHSVIDLAYQYCNTIPNFALLFQNVLRAGLVGNLGVSKNRLVLAARIRVESAMTNPLRSTTSTSNLIDVPREKKKHRQKKRLDREADGGEVGPEEPTWLSWFRKHQYVMTFLMREWHVQVACDASEFAKIAEQHVKVRQGAMLVCSTNAALRSHLNRQCVRQTDPRSPLSWDLIDGGENGGADAGGEKTIIGFSHVQSRLVFMHLRHRGFIDLLWDKSKSVPNQRDGRVSLPKNVTPEHLQFVAWCFVTQGFKTGIEPLGILKSLGLTEGGFSLLRDMQYVYYEYKCRPSRFQHWMKALYIHSKTDFGIICRFLAYVRRFKNERMFYLPADEKAMQIIQQRRTIRLSSIDATTSNLGSVYHCRVCKSWSLPIVSAGGKPDPQSFLATVRKHAITTKDPTAIVNETNKVRFHTTCPTSCYTDPFTGDVFCKNSGVLHTDNPAKHKKARDFTYLRDYYDADVNSKRSCSEQPMWKIYMPGVLLPMGTGIIGLCYFCHNACKVKVENWTSYGITCGDHDIREHGDEHPSAIAYDCIYSL